MDQVANHTQPDSRGAPRPASCFATRLERYATLTDDECAFIARMEETERPLPKGASVAGIGSTSDELFVLKEGWALSRSADRDGRRQAVRVFLPGEVIGLYGMGLGQNAYEVVMATAGVVCPFPKTHLTAVYDKAPRLAALFGAISGMDQVTVTDRLALMGAGNAREQMAHFLLDLHERLLITNPDLGRRYRLPLRQVDIGEVLGLTKVYVNRLLKSFVSDGLIEIQRPYVRILKPEALRDMSGYVNRYDQMDHSWFPSVARNDLSPAE